MSNLGRKWLKENNYSINVRETTQWSYDAEEERLYEEERGGGNKEWLIVTDYGMVLRCFNELEDLEVYIEGYADKMYRDKSREKIERGDF